MAAYLQSADYAAYGIPDTTAAQVEAASRMVDAQIGRPEGLLWAPDADGNPAWMASKTPTRTYRLASNIAAGTGITLTIANASFGPGELGSVVILDRSTTPEACLVAAVAGNTITLASVAHPHLANATLDFGLAITQECAVAHGGMVRTSARPLARVLGISGSYRSGGNPSLDWVDELATIGQPAWSGFPVAQCDVDDTTGMCWLLPGDVRGGFARVRMSYVAGWSYDNLPLAIRQATANLVQAASDAEFGGNWTLMKAGNATIQRASATLFDAETLALLTPYRSFRI